MSVQALTWALSLSGLSPVVKLVAIGLTDCAKDDGGANNSATLTHVVEFCNVCGDQVRAALETLRKKAGLNYQVSESGEISFSLPI